MTPDAPPGLRYDVSSRTCHLCVDGTGGDYSLGGTYGDEVTQVFGVIPDDDSIRSPDTSQYGNGDIYYYGPSIYFSASGQSTMLSKPVWTGTFYYLNDKTDPAAGASDIFGHSLENGPGPPRDGLSFTGTNEVPALSNSNWLISYESVWSFTINPGPDLWPGHPVTRLKYFPMTSPPAGVLSGGTRFPDSLNGGALAISRATQASNDMVALTGTSGGYYVWNFPNAQAQPIAIRDTLLGISTRYLTPPPTASGTTPVPDFQVLGTGYLWEPALDGTTGLPITPTKYIGTTMSDLLTTATNWTQFSPTGINDAGAIVGTGYALDQHGNIVADANGSNIQHGLLLLPVELKQTNYPTNVLPDGTDAQLTGTTQVISSGTAGGNCTAYITGAPAMPTLQISIANGSLSGMNVQWWMTTTSDRSVRGTQDNVQIPNPQVGYRTLPINQAWEIDNDYGGQFFGGKCTIHYIIQDASGNALTPEMTFPFLIRGRNPKDSTAQGYIYNNDNNFEYAWAIAQHESRTPSNKIYNQFATANGSSWGDLGQPFYSPLEGNGWGMFQRDPTGGGIPVTIGQVYSWQVNTQAAIQELGQKWSNTDRFLRYFRNKYGNQAGWQEPPQSYTISNSHFSAWDLGTMVLYNSSAGCPRSTVTDDNGHSTTIQFPWTFNPNGSPKWVFHDNSQAYATHVIQDEWEAGLPYSE